MSNPNTAKLPYREGTWFGVPLRQGGIIVGRVARHSPEGEIVLAYFFGPKRPCLPTLDEVAHSKPGDALKVMMVGSLGLVEGTWPIIGDSQWNRAEWPIPPFKREDELSGMAWRVIYADDNPNQVVSEERIAYDTPGLERNRLSGHRAAEIHLSKLF